ncbi:MAG: endolytic transglycosylase MltG [Candidatus Omnitrophota bacterium]
MRKIAIRTIGAIVVAAAVVLGIMAFMEYRSWNKPWGTADQQFNIEISEGMNARQIGNLLVENGVLKNTTLFLILADLRGFGEKLKAGEYLVKGTQSPYEIVEMFAEGKNYLRSLVVPEGFTQIDIAKALEGLQVCKKEDFLKECLSRNIFKFVVVQAPGGANAACEGILFPDTYFFIKNQETERIFDRMSNHFQKEWEKILEDAFKIKANGWWWQEGGASESQQTHRVVVLASIIEKEAKHDEDRPLIASVFVNRMKKNMPLQADSTIHYALEDWSRSLQLSDLEFDSPYNTYKNVGLPPAAICNPGEASLRAAAMPADSEYLYFLTMKDGSAQFSMTNEDHIKLKIEMKRQKGAE